MKKEALHGMFGRLRKAGTCVAIAFICLGRGLSQTQDAAAQAPPQSAEDLVAGLYGLVSSPGGQLPDWNKVRDRFLKEAVIVLRTSRAAMTVFSLDGFIQDFIDFYERPVKTPEAAFSPKDKGFSEKVLRIRTWEYGDIAHVLVLYEARIIGVSRPPQQGIDSWHLIRRGGRWFISAVTNEVVTPEWPVPPELQPDLPAVRKTGDLATSKAQLEQASKSGNKASALELAELMAAATKRSTTRRFTPPRVSMRNLITGIRRIAFWHAQSAPVSTTGTAFSRTTLSRHSGRKTCSVRRRAEPGPMDISACSSARTAKTCRTLLKS